MKQHWKDRLSRIDDSDERRFLRDVLSSAFSNIEEYTNVQLDAIKARVFEESTPVHNQFDVYTSLVSLDDYDPINDFLFPMNPTDLEELPFDAAVITEVVAAGEKPILGKLYFELDYLELLKIKATLPNRKFKGELKTNRDTYEIEVSLAPYMGYLNQIERLYELHLDNNVSWRTVLHPSIHKFVKMQLETEVIFKKQEKIEEIMIDLEELDAYKQINQIPLWNIQTKPFSNQGFPMPAGDRINYEHVLLLKEDIRKLGYLIDSDSEVNGIINIRVNLERLILTSSKDVISDWNLWTIVNPLEADLDFPNLTSNAKIASFIDNHVTHSGRTIRTIGEIFRLANLFESTTSLKLVDIDMNAKVDGNFETYTLNSFIKDEIRIDEDKLVMKLKFTTDKLNPSTRDMMSFLTSELALYFPEYRCVGELI